MATLTAFLFLATVNIATGFAPNLIRHAFISAKWDDATHVSITENAIKKAVQAYFVELNSHTTTTQPHTTAKRSLGGNLLKLRRLVDLTTNTVLSELAQIFELRYGTECDLDLVAYQNAVNEITDANANTDIDDNTKNNPDFHFDAERFKETNANIISLRDKAHDLVNQKSYGEARKALGPVLHMIQDFYSHSNYVEMGKTEPNRGFGTPNNDFGIPLASPTAATCEPCPTAFGECRNNILITDQLTSGYFQIDLPDSKPETDANGNAVVKPKGSGKCSHGGLFDKTSLQDPIGGINKDVGDVPGSPHFYLHHQAADLAEQSSVEFMNSFRSMIGNDAFENLLQLKQQQCQTSGRRRRAVASTPKVNASATVPKITMITANESSSVHEWSLHDQISARHSVVIATAISNFSSSLIVPIDSTVQQIIIKTSPVSNLEPDNEILLITPKGDNNTFKTVFQNGLAAFLKIQNPEPGLWRFRVLGKRHDATYSVTIFGNSTWDVIVNVLVMEERLRHARRPGVAAVQPGQVLHSGTKLFITVMSPMETANVTQLELRGIDGILIKGVPVSEKPFTQDGFAKYLFEVAVPQEKFRVVVRASDNKGYVMARASEMVYAVTRINGSQSDEDAGFAPKSANDTSSDDHHVLLIDRNSALSVAALTSFFVFLWLLAILAVILLKVATEKCRGRKETPPSSSAGYITLRD